MHTPKARTIAISINNASQRALEGEHRQTEKVTQSIDTRIAGRPNTKKNKKNRSSSELLGRKELVSMTEESEEHE